MSLAGINQLIRLLKSTLLVALAISCFALSASAQSATFAGRDYPIVGNTHISADFNGDGKYNGQFNLAANPQSITIRSSLGGSATKTVVAR